MGESKHMKKSREVMLLTCISLSLFVLVAEVYGQRTGTSRQGLATIGSGVKLWTENNNIVPVCWETNGYDREKEIVEQSVINTWQRHTTITFKGWGICPFGGIAGSATTKQVRIRITPLAKNKDGVYPNSGGDGSARFGMQALSSASENNPGMHMAFAPDGSASKGRVEYIGVHEFGHVMGFIHEQNSPNHDATHCAGGTEKGSTSLTDYDPDSIMNYCNSDGNGAGNLTAKDIEGLRRLYGQPQIGQAFKLGGSGVAFNGPRDRFVVTMGNRIIVTTQDGGVFGHDVSGNAVAPAFKLGGSPVAFNGAQDRFLLTMGDRMIVITQSGDVFGHDVARGTVGPAFKFEGSRVAYNGSLDRFVVTMAKRLIVITQSGDVFGHDVTGNRIGPAFKFAGSRVAFNPGDRFVVTTGNRLIVITQSGETFGHDVTGNTIGPAFKFVGSKVAYNGARDRFVVTMGNLIIVTTQDAGVFGHNF
jgi:cytochrome c551/c552